MTRQYDIPIISRGTVIEPGEDAIEFKGRGGATFRTPDPHKHVTDLILGNPARLQDLMDTPTRDIVDFLAEVGKRLRLEDNELLQESFALGLEAGGLSEPILRGVYDALPGSFDPEALLAQADRTIGIDYLDGWVPADGEHGNCRVRAVGTRQLHITAGNVPVDPLTANAIARTLIEVDANHPVTKHVAVAYWKGGDEFMDSQIVRTSRIDKITAWGGMASVKHIQKYLTPGIDLTAMNPKFSMSVIGKEALQSEEAMDEAAMGIAVISGFFNQTACSNTRIVYVESDSDDESVEKIAELGRRVLAAYKEIPALISTPAAGPNRDLDAELDAVALEDDFYHVEGDTVNGGFVVSKFADRVDFFGDLNNRVVNYVPMEDLLDIVQWCDDTTQTVGVYPEALRERLLDPLALAGVQRMVPLEGNDPMAIFEAMHHLPPGMPHDGIEPLRRNVRWVIDQRSSGEAMPMSIAAE
jgi:hypothetical protein